MTRSAVLIMSALLVSSASAQTFNRVSYEQFGAVGDGVTDDTTAMIAARDALRAHQDARLGEDVKSIIDMGQGKCYAYSDNRIWWGLRDLIVNGNSACLLLQYPTFIDNLVLPTALVVGHTYHIQVPGTTNWTTVGSANNAKGTLFTATGTTTGTGFALPASNPTEGSTYTYGINGPFAYTYTGVGPWPSGASVGTYYLFNRSGLETETASANPRSGSAGFAQKPVGPYINTVTAGASKVTCIVTGQCNAAIFPVGQWVMINSYSMQAGGSWPPNMRYFDYAKVLSADGTNVTLDRNLTHSHRSDYPQEPTNSGTLTAGWGPASIVTLGDPVGSVAPAVPFGDSLLVENLTFKYNPYNGQSADCCSPSTTYGSDWPGDHHFFYAHTFTYTSGYYSVTLNNITTVNLTPSGSSLVTCNNCRLISGGEIDKLLTSVTLNNTTSFYEIGGCSAEDTVNYIGGMYTTQSFTTAPIACTGRTVNITGVLATSPHLSLNNFNSTIGLTTGGLIYPSTMNVTNSIFIGADKNSTPIGGTQSGTAFTIDGSVIVASTGSQIDITNFMPPQTGWKLLACAYEGRTLTIHHSGMNYTGTISTITTDGNPGGSFINLTGLPISMVTGDTVTCFPYQPGSVTESGNTYTNYGGGPILP